MAQIIRTIVLFGLFLYGCAQKNASSLQNTTQHQLESPLQFQDIPHTPSEQIIELN